MISLSSVLETTHQIPNLDYSHLFQVIQRICFDQEDIYEAYRRMVFNVLYENKDDHGKNFAFIYDEKLKGYRLSPFYDITKTPMKMEHEMTVLGKGNPDEEDLLEIAKKFNLSVKNCEKIIVSIKQNIYS
jgi:serine/threonine-protein kinase HipA